MNSISNWISRSRNLFFYFACRGYFSIHGITPVLFAFGAQSLHNATIKLRRYRDHVAQFLDGQLYTLIGISTLHELSKSNETRLI